MSKKIAENGIVRYRFYRIVFQKRPYRLVSFSVSFFRNDRIVFGIVPYRFSEMTVSFRVEIGIDRYRFCRYRKLKVTFWDPGTNRETLFENPNTGNFENHEQ